MTNSPVEDTGLLGSYFSCERSTHPFKGSKRHGVKGERILLWGECPDNTPNCHNFVRVPNVVTGLVTFSGQLQ